MRRALPLLLLLSFAAAAQQVGQNAQPGAPAGQKLSVSTQLVIENVTVKDKSGKPVTGLKCDDFAVTEDGAAQKLAICEPIELPTTATAMPPATIDQNEIKTYNQLGRMKISTEKPGSLLYKDHRLIALYFDMTSMPPADQMRALSAGEKFIRTQMTTADLVAIFRYAGAGVDVLQNFTDNRERLLSVIQTLVVGEGQGFDETPADASTSDNGAAFGQDDSEFNIFNTDRQLAALQTAAKMLGQLSEKKALIYFASGLRLNGLDNQAQLHATIDSAIRSGVEVWAVDARGLVAQAPMGDATRGSQGNLGMYTGAVAMAVTSNLQRSQDTLYGLAEDTGGKALLDYNDLSKGIVDAQQADSSYYILGYYATNTNLDGKFRKINITLTKDIGAKLDYRHGYYAGKVFGKFTAADKDRQLEDALMLEDPITDLTIAMEIDYFQQNRAEYYVPIIMKIPGRELALAKRGGAEHTVIDFIGEIKDDYGGRTVTNLHDKVDVKLSDATAAELAKRPIEYDTGYTLLPGKYMIKVLARDDETGRMGTYQTKFTIPNLNKDDKRVPISSVVLSSEKKDVRDAIYNVAKEKVKDKNDSVNPLIQNGTEIIPSVTRVFSKSRDMYVYLQAYQQGVPAAQPLLGFVTFYRDSKKVYETEPLKVVTGATSRLNTMSLNISVPLTELTPGEYDCQVTVLDPTGQRAAFWQAPVVVVPQ